MGQHLTEKDVRQIAEYARIGMDDVEIAAMTVDLNSMIDGLAPLMEFDLEGVEPTFHPIGGLSNVMREDVEVSGFTREEALANAPRQQDGCFLIPSILGAPAVAEDDEQGEEPSARSSAASAASEACLSTEGCFSCSAEIAAEGGDAE